jgi:hypothetical protein
MNSKIYKHCIEYKIKKMNQQHLPLWNYFLLDKLFLVLIFNFTAPLVNGGY